MPRTMRSILAALLLLALAVPAAGAEASEPCTDEEGELVLEEQEVFIRESTAKAGNLAALGATSFPSWSEDAPARSVQEGAGGGYLANTADSLLNEDETLAGLTIEGESQGCLDTILLDLYAFLPTNRTGSNGDLEERPFAGYVTVYADGRELLFTTEVTFATEPNPLGSATYRARMAITEVNAALQRLELDPEASRTLRINVIPRWVNTNNAVFVYDTTEVPAGLTFNGDPGEDYPTVRA